MNELAVFRQPGRLWGDRPERSYQEAKSYLEHKILSGIIKSRRDKQIINIFSDVLIKIENNIKAWENLDSNNFYSLLQELRTEISINGLNNELICKVFAIVSIQIHQQLQIRPYAEQYMAGWCMLHGNLAEMQTGEGKTLSIAFPAIAAALANIPVHIITVNDYLVKRDSSILQPLYNSLGLSVGIVTPLLNDTERRNAYASDIVYCTNKQVVFDYLRDTRSLGTTTKGLSYKLRSLFNVDTFLPAQRGLCFAILDEADSVLIDEAKVPLILSESNKNTSRTSVDEKVALGIAHTLHEGIDFIKHDESMYVSLTENGLEVAKNLSNTLEGAWRFDRYRNELIKQALTALHIYRIDKNYIVRDNKVVLIDENTGRTMPDRKLQNGLHHMLEIKEKCNISDHLETTSSISFQRFFLKYHQLTGLSGTLREVENELSRVYELSITTIPPHRPSKMLNLGIECYPDRPRQIARLLTIINKRHHAQQPILIGTRSVELSQRISDVLSACKLNHQLLNAAQDENEALIIARAGVPGAITVATNMAGRGTDIPLSGNSAELGGLHVINMELNESPRIDRQLYGRAARQGAPGSYQALYSINDDILNSSFRFLERLLKVSRFSASAHPSNILWPFIIRLIQWRHERTHMKQRLNMFSGYSDLVRQLNITGNME